MGSSQSEANIKAARAFAQQLQTLADQGKPAIDEACAASAQAFASSSETPSSARLWRLGLGLTEYATVLLRASSRALKLGNQSLNQPLLLPGSSLQGTGAALLLHLGLHVLLLLRLTLLPSRAPQVLLQGRLFLPLLMMPCSPMMMVLTPCVELLPRHILTLTWLVLGKLLLVKQLPLHILRLWVLVLTLTQSHLVAALLRHILQLFKLLLCRT